MMACPSVVVFTFPPLGWQRVNMGRPLFEHNAVFRAAMRDCARHCDPELPTPLLEVLYPDDESTGPMLLPTQALPAVFAVEYALFAMCQFDACAPDAVVGHSLGEFVAAVAAGVLTLQAACTLVCARAAAMEALASTGSMVSLRAPVDVAQSLLISEGLSGRATVAAINGPASCVVSGDTGALSQLVSALPVGTKSARVHVSHPDHSPAMAPVAAALCQRATELYATNPPAPPTCLWTSTVTGAAMSEAECADPAYWARHALAPVDYSAALSTVLAFAARRDGAHDDELESRLESSTAAIAAARAATASSCEGGVMLPAGPRCEGDGALYLMEMGDGMLEAFAADLLAATGSTMPVVSSVLLPRAAVDATATLRTRCSGGCAREAEACKEDAMRALRADKLQRFLLT